MLLGDSIVMFSGILCNVYQSLWDRAGYDSVMRIAMNCFETLRWVYKDEVCETETTSFQPVLR